jgi:CRP-like cAMP-binding protein
MENPATRVFDAHDFLAKVGVGKTILKLQKNQTVFMQGDAAETIYYIQHGQIKLTVLSEHAKEAVVGILGPASFLAKAA